ncbi:MAG: GAF domain-containing protein, partial [Candidatus Promineifilaceae bacterium]
MTSIDELTRLKTAAERAQSGYHNEEAILQFSEAIALAPTDDDDPDSLKLRYGLYLGRGKSNIWIGESRSAMADFEEAIRLAEMMPLEDRNLVRQADALNRLANITREEVGIVEGEELAKKALDLARQAGDLQMEARSKEELSQLENFKNNSTRANELAEQALELYRQAGDKSGEANMLARMAYSRGRKEASESNIDLALQAAALARQIGDLPAEAGALNVAGIVIQDLAQKRTYYERALAIAMAIGRRGSQASIANNLAQLCYTLGLYRRGLAYTDFQISIAPHNLGTLAFNSDIRGLNTLGLNLVDEAEAAWRQGVKASQEIESKGLEHYSVVGLGLVALARGHANEAVQIFSNLIAEMREIDSAIISHVLAWKAAAHLALDEIDEARRNSDESVELFEAGIHTPEYSAAEIWLIRFKVLAAGYEEHESWRALDRARAEMLKTVASLSDEGLRRNYFNKVEVNREIIDTWLREATSLDQPLEPLTASLRGASDLQEQFRRLNEIGVRLNTHREGRDLPSFILDEFIELTGAEKASVLLQNEFGAPIVAAVNSSTDGAEFLTKEIVQLLEDTGFKGLPHLSHSPDGAHPLNQTSILCLPLLTHDKTIGWLYAELSGRYGRFTLQDQDLANVLANQAAVALENADWADTLEQKVEQRTAELAVINSVQEGLAAELDLDAIVELVGEKIREVFNAQGIGISLYNRSTGVVSMPYFVDDDVRMDIPPVQKSYGFTGHILDTGESLLVNHDLPGRMKELGSELIGDSERVSKAYLGVPIIVGETVTGVISLVHYDRENIYTDSDVNLLQTLANSMSVALENARLFDETTQKAAELTIINSVQEGLAAELEIQAIYDLVGDKIREIFDTQAIYISNYDYANEEEVYFYLWEKGKRYYPDPIPFNDFIRHLINQREALVFNENASEQLGELGSITIPGTEPVKSAVFINLLSGEQIFGCISLQNVDREHAFSESDVRLLTTLANSMSVALENARLFSEVQAKNVVISKALERETASNDILKVIAESPTDIQPVLDTIVQNAARLSGTEDAIIAVKDKDMLLVKAHYGDIPMIAVGEGIRFNRDSVAGRAMMEGQPIQAILDHPGSDTEYPEGDAVAKQYGYHLTCAVPLMR